MSIGTRLVLMFPGFEPMPVEAHCRRFLREAARTAPVYSATFDSAAAETEPDPAAGVPTGRLAIVASGPGWSTRTQVIIYGLGEINEGYAQANPVVRIARGLFALADFVATGTFFRYLATGVRYGLFFVFPILVMLAAILLALILFKIGLEMSPLAPVLVAGVLGAAGFVAIIVLASSKLHFLLIMDDWVFARDLARGRRGDVEARLDRIAADACRRAASSEAAEIVFAAHSFGAVAAAAALAEAVRTKAGHERTGFLTVGSSILKIALHPAASRFRRAVSSIVAADLPWLDVQSLTDILNFYGTCPARLVAGQAGPKQNTTKVRFRNQLEPDTYRSLRRDFFRVHRQFVFGVERRSHYSYHMILCGPEPFAAVTRRGGLADDWNFGGAAGP